MLIAISPSPRPQQSAVIKESVLLYNQCVVRLLAKTPQNRFDYLFFVGCHNCDLQRNGGPKTYGCALTDGPEHRVCHRGSCTTRDMGV